VGVVVVVNSNGNQGQQEFPFTN